VVPFTAEIVAPLQDSYTGFLSTYYVYDEFNRLRLVYDMSDRLVFTQDGNMFGTGKWKSTLYDKLNRQGMTGMIVGFNGNRDALQQAVDNLTKNSPPDVIFEGMLFNKFPIPGAALLLLHSPKPTMIIMRGLIKPLMRPIIRWLTRGQCPFCSFAGSRE
jgi:hypothetical protein